MYDDSRGTVAFTRNPRVIWSDRCFLHFWKAKKSKPWEQVGTDGTSRCLRKWHETKTPCRCLWIRPFQTNTLIGNHLYPGLPVHLLMISYIMWVCKDKLNAFWPKNYIRLFGIELSIITENHFASCTHKRTEKSVIEH